MCPSRGQVVLLVNPLGVEADLTAVVDGTAVFLRTTRISSDPPPLPALLAEIRLTMAAASNQLGGRKIESIVLCGEQQPDLDLARAIEAELEIHVELFDPFGGVKLGRALVESPPQHPGRFAPLVGMLLAELKPSNHAVDFLHPRRRAAAADPRKKWMIAAAAAAVLLLGLDRSTPASIITCWPAVADQLSREVERPWTSRSPTRKESPRQHGRNRQVGRRRRDLARSHLRAGAELPAGGGCGPGPIDVNSGLRGGQIELERLGPPARRHCPLGRRHSRPRRQNEREEQPRGSLRPALLAAPSRPRSCSEKSEKP